MCIKTNKNKFISRLKFSSINIIGIRGKKLELLAFLDFHQPQIVAIQEAPRDIAIFEWEINNIKIKNPVYHIFFVETASL